jgi:hypothetical protein
MVSGYLPSKKDLANHLIDGRNIVKNLTDPIIVFSMRMVDSVVHQGQLSVVFLALFLILINNLPFPDGH